jgi:outer membrane lipoprotein-sorting protein
MQVRTRYDSRNGHKPGAIQQLATCAIAFMFVGSAAASDIDKVLSLLADMEDAWSNIVDYTKQVDKTERLVDGDVTEQTVLIKYRRPGEFYMTVLDGENKGGELIYPARKGAMMAVAHAGGFKGGLARFLVKTVVLRGAVPTEFRLDDPLIGRRQHQTVLETSLGATIARIARNVRSAIENGEGTIIIGQDCPDTARCQLRLDFELPATAGQMHEVQQGETLWTISSSYDQSMYAIWYNNRNVKRPEKVDPGQILFIPRYYAARGTVWVSADSSLPTRIEILDASGKLYERYVYSDVQINIGLTDLDFDSRNPDYRF